MNSFFTRYCAWLLAALLLLASPFAMAANKESSLPQQYRQWLDRDVAYIITNEERQAFLNLASDKDRDSFINQFWELRNPTPGAPGNPYKDDIYRRIAYTSDHFGREGWRTDRGRVYITLGPPQQTAKYLGIPNVRPMEIWFYQNAHPALPSFFYVLFYQREVGDEFRLYSPYVDGPEKLMIGSGNENDRVAALNVIDREAGREVARTTLSLIPNEPVDMDTATTSMASDVMIATIRGLANNPFTKDMLQERRRLLEQVSHRLIIPGEYLDVLTASFLDAEGNTQLHYLLRVKRPEDFSVVQDQDQRSRYYYSAKVTVRVLTPDSKPIFTQERNLSRYLSETELLQMQHKAFGYEGMLPLSPGKYKIEFVLSDEVKHTAFRQLRDIVVPQPPAQGLSVSDVVPFSDAVGDRDSSKPFDLANVKFTPLDPQGMTVVAGRDLKFLYQVWAPPRQESASDDSVLDVEYAYGRLGMHDIKTISDHLPRNQFAANGALVNGKKIPTADLAPGNYRLTITVSDPATHERAFSSFGFLVADSLETPDSWDVSDPDALKEKQDGVADYNRALCFLSAGDSLHAIGSFRRALQKRPDERVSSRLIDLLYSRQAFADIVDIYSRQGISPATEDGTIVQIGESLDKVGQLNKSIQLLESALQIKPSGLLYLTLAGYYHQAGNTQKAAEMEQKGKTMTAASPTS